MLEGGVNRNMHGQTPSRGSMRRESGVIGRVAQRVRRAAALASRQHGAISRSQLRSIGYTDDMIDRDLRTGRLIPAYRGVYFLGHLVMSEKSRAMAATLACGAGAVISHRSAAHLWCFLPYPAHYIDIEITVPGRDLHTRDGIQVHRVHGFDRRDVRTLDHIPITSPARTLLDLSAAAPDKLEQAFDEAVFQRKVRMPQLHELIERSDGRRGVKALRRLTAAESAGERSRLEAEKRCLRLIRAAKLPLPQSNAPLGPFVLDFFWPQHCVAVELDGFATHGKRRMFEADRARDGDLQARGMRVVRVTWRQLTREPYAVVARLAAVLALSMPDREPI